MRIGNKKHLKRLSGLSCMICGAPDPQVHHLLRAEPRGVGLKTGDQWCVPLCHTHHSELHRNGNEVEFFRENGFEYEAVKKYAEMLWRASSGS
jgi:hypothetical protein